MSLNALTYIPTLLLTLLLAFFILIKKRDKKSVVFSLFIFSVSIWVATLLIVDTTKNRDIALIFGKIAIIGPIFVSYLLVLFSYYFPIVVGKKKSMIFVFMAVPLILFMLFVPTKYNLKSVEIRDWGAETIPGEMYYFFIVYFLIYTLVAIRGLIKKFYSLTGIFRVQIRYVLFGLGLSLFISILTNAILPLFGIVNFSIFGPPSVLLFISLTVYAILRHSLLDIVVIIRKVTILGILLMIILGIFLMGAFGLPFVFADSLPEDSFQITLVAVAFIVAIFFHPLRRSIEEFTDRWFFKGAYKPQQVIDELSEKISTIIDLRVLLDATAQILLKAFRSEHAVFSVREKIGRAEKDAESAEQKFIAYNTEGRHRPMEEFTYDGKNPFVRYFNKYTGEVIIRDELQKDLEEVVRGAPPSPRLRRARG